MTIYMIVRNTKREDYGGRDYWDEEIDPDYGYFTNANEAIDFAEELSAPAKARYWELMQRYDASVESERAKAQEAKRLGFRHDQRPEFRPDEPDYYTMLAIDLHSEKG